MFTRESIAKEIKRIQDSVPKLLRDFTLIETLKTPAMKLVAEKAMEDESLPEEKRRQIKLLYDKGMFSGKKIVENAKVAKQRDDWVKRELKKAVKEGRLPTKKQLKELKLAELHNE